MAKYLTEFIGTFFLVLAVGLVVTGSGGPTAVIAIGCMLMCMVYMGGHISGAHYNPAVTLGLVIAGKCEAKELVPYWVSQLLGGIAGSALAQTLSGKQTSIQPAALPVHIPLIVEIIFTFGLALVVLNVAAHEKMKGSPIYGLAIGFFIVAAAYIGGPISGGAFNPAVGTAMSLFMDSKEHLWLYWAGPLVGAVLAAGVFKVQEMGPSES